MIKTLAKKPEPTAHKKARRAQPGFGWLVIRLGLTLAALLGLLHLADQAIRWGFDNYVH